MSHGFVRIGWGVACVLLGAGLAGGCRDEAAKPPVRPVVTVKAAYEVRPEIAAQVGEIRPHYESDIGFKIGGRILVRDLKLGQVLKAGEVIARLDDRDQANQVRAAEADLAAAEAARVQAAAEDRRKVRLHADGWATAAALEAAQKARIAAEAAVAAAKAKLRIAKDQLGYAVLCAPSEGVVTALGAEAGQVVAAGQMIARIARSDEKEAVFSLSQTVLPSLPADPKVTVSLLDAPGVTTPGRVSEISPSADSVTRTYTVKVALPGAPEAMRLGMSVLGRFETGSRRVAALPSAALFQDDGAPAVWVVDPAALTVALVKVDLVRVDPGSVLVGGGVPDGALVVAAGVQTLRPGQKVRLADGAGS